MQANSSKFLLSNKFLLMNSGYKIPIIGLGTFRIKSQEEIDEAVKAAWDAGYRHIDSAIVYQNEKLIGNAIKKYNIPREQLFITTKIPTTGMKYEETLRLVDESLLNFQTNYLDLVLIHFPRVKFIEDRIGVWKALEKCVDEGKVRSIGVSNFLPIHLNSILDNCIIKPSVNQFEISPLFIDNETIEMCRKENIVIEAYSSFARFDDKLIKNPTLVSICKIHNKSPSQVIVRWCIQHDYVVLPKSVRRDRIFENINVDDFDLTNEEMNMLDGLNCDYKVAWDPRSVNF